MLIKEKERNKRPAKAPRSQWLLRQLSLQRKRERESEGEALSFLNSEKHSIKQSNKDTTHLLHGHNVSREPLSSWKPTRFMQEEQIKTILGGLKSCGCSCSSALAPSSPASLHTQGSPSTNARQRHSHTPRSLSHTHTFTSPHRL